MTIEIETLEAAALDPRARQHMVPMRDGVELATDVYLPDGPGPWPAVLVRLPYDKNGRYCWMPFISRHFTERGYAFLPQDVRGKFRSRGRGRTRSCTRSTTATTRSSGSREQPWSNGDVGMWGDSYYGFTQWAAVASGHPALKAIVPRVTVADLFGWLDGDGVTPLYGAHYLAQYWSDGHTHHWTPDWTRRPLSEVFDPAFELIGSALARLRPAARRRRAASAAVDMYADAPSVHAAAHPDAARRRLVRQHHSAAHARLRARSMGDPATAPFQYLHAGSTDHENYRFESVPIPESRGPRHARRCARADAAALPRPRARLLRRLPGRPQRPANRCRACAGICRNVGWRESPVWPPPGAREQRLHLDRRRAVLSEAVAAEGAVAMAARSARTWCPPPSRTRSPSCTSTPTRMRSRRGPTSWCSTGGRLAEPLTLAGRVVAHLTVAGDGPSMYLHVKLVDVEPGGRAHTSCSTASARSTTPGDGTAAEVYLGHTGYRCPGGPPAAAAGRLQRLPAVRAASGDVREPVVRDSNGGQPPAPADRRRDPVASERNHARRVATWAGSVTL